MKERVIYLKDLFYYICRKWRIALILMLVFALVLNFYGWYRAKKAISVPTGNDVLEELRSGLSEKERFDAENRARNYSSYFQQYIAQSEYMEHSIYFNLDPTTAPTYTAVFYTDSTVGLGSGMGTVQVTGEKSQTADQGAAVLFAVRSIIDSSEAMERAAEILGLQDQKQYVRELYKTRILGSNLTLTVHASSEEKAQNVGKALSALVQEKKDAFTELYGEYRLEMVDEQVFTGPDYEMIANQASVISRNASLENMMKATNDNLPSAARAYYNALLSGQAEEILPNEAAVPVKIKLLYPKWIIVGLILGLVLYFLAAAFVYIVSGKLRTAEEVRESFGVRVLSEVRASDRKKKGLDTLVEKAFGDGKRLLNVEAGVSAACERILYAVKPQEKLLLLCDEGSEAARKMMDASVKQLKEGGADASVECGNTADPHIFQKLREADAVVFFKHLGHCGHEDFIREKECVADAGKDVVGAVLLKD